MHCSCGCGDGLLAGVIMIITEASRINQHLKHPRDRHLVQYPSVSQYMYIILSRYLGGLSAVINATDGAPLF